MLLTDSQLKTLFSEKKVIDEKSIAELYAFARNAHIPFAQAAIERGVVTDEKLGKMTADFLNLPFVEVSKTRIPQDIFHLIPEVVARKHKTIIFNQSERNISIATSYPDNAELFDMIEKKISKKPVIHYATHADIDATIQMYRKDLQHSVDELIKQDLIASGALTSDAPIIKIVDLLITYAYRDKASDIHIEPEEGNVLVRFRIDSVLRDVLVVDKNLHSSIVTRIKVLSNLRTDEHLDSQDGKMRMDLDGEKVDIRVSVIPTTEGEKIVMRLLSSKFRSFSLSDLGMNSKDLEKVYDAVNKSYGMILSTGPTGSGKTTSIYSLLKILNTREKNITTIEDPVEYRIKGVNHIPVNAKTSLTFANGLRSILRQDPNVIFVGEIRDSETADIAVNASLTGHLVLSTLHTSDAATALPRLIDMKVEPFLIASTMNVIIAQRLVRKICSSCKKESSIKREFIRKDIAKQIPDKYFGKKAHLKVFVGEGCNFCNFTGYSGRIGIFEVLQISEKIRQLIIQKQDSATIRKAAINEGMTPLLEDGLQKVALGVTSLEEVLRVIKSDEL
ncbi:MAG TPA: GspE/PulE family protein [Candidatus Eisenbacteria bacterium]|nr:GspE/PulE family protein [Candidatus Eisenbacteria bacterium]